MIETLNADWKKVLHNELNKSYFDELTTFVDLSYQTSVCYPNKSEIFNAFNLCSIEDVKVVIIGQDPYHGKNQQMASVSQLMMV